MNDKIIDKELAKMIFGDSEEMYRKYLFQLEERDLYGQMEAHLADGDVGKAFETAHTMKGLVQNLALTDFSKYLEKLVEVMRGGDRPAEEDLAQTRRKYDEILAYIKEIKANDIKVLQ